MSSTVVREIVLNGRKVKYTLEYKNVKNINIHINPSKGFYISAPSNVDLKALEDQLKMKSTVILDAIDKCEKINNGENPSNFRKPKKSIRSIVLKGNRIEYELNFKNVKRINLSVSIDKGVRISAPKNATVQAVEKFMTENADFILNAVQKYEKLADTLPKAKQYVDGEYIYFLGDKKTLHVTQSVKNFVEVNGSEIRLFVTDTKNFNLKENVMDSFLKNECDKYVTKMCRDLYPRFSRKGIEFPKEIRFKKMVSCWGNCRPKLGILTFSTYLIQLPPRCIEAVVCHEFTHFLHENHSKAFYNQLTEFMPDWRLHDKLMKELQKEIIIRNK